MTKKYSLQKNIIFAKTQQTRAYWKESVIGVRSNNGNKQSVKQTQSEAWWPRAVISVTAGLRVIGRPGAGSADQRRSQVEGRGSWRLAGYRSSPVARTSVARLRPRDPAAFSLHLRCSKYKRHACAASHKEISRYTFDCRRISFGNTVQGIEKIVLEEIPGWEKWVGNITCDICLRSEHH